MNLVEKNTCIEQDLKDKRLICELAFNRNDFDLWSSFLPHDIGVWKNYPFIAAAMTVGAGVYEYEQGDYWHAFPWFNTAGHQNKWGKKFKKFLENHETLESFKSLEGHPYVAKILAHGGIPSYCINDFFALVVHNADPEQPSGDFIEFLNTNPSCSQNIDRPVKRFLFHGGEAAEEFLSRFFALWQSRERGDGGGTYGLPQRVVESFGQWYEKNCLTHRQRRRRKKIPRASLRIKPGDLDIFLYLPRCDSHPEINKNTLWKALGKSWAVTSTHEIPLPLADKWDVRIGRQKTTIEGISNSLPVMFFDRETGKAIHDPKRRRLPEHIWVVFPQSSKTSPEPSYSERLLAWTGYEIAVFDLSGQTNLMINELEFEIRRPFFQISEDPIIPWCKSEKGVPIFNSAPKIFWEGVANFTLNKNGIDQGSIDIEARDFELLIDEPGEYNFHLRGPFGQNVRKHFLFIPGFNFKLEPEVWWPVTDRIRLKISADDFQFLSGENRFQTFLSKKPQFDFRAVLGSKKFSLTAEVPILKWRLTKAEGEAREWTNEPLEINVQDLQQIDFPRIVLELANSESSIMMSMLGNQGFIFPPAGAKSKISKQNTWFFDLREVRNQVMQTGHAEKFDILIEEANKRVLYQGPVLNVRPYWNLCNFQAEWNKDKLHEICIFWSDQGKLVADRWLLLIPLWRPTKHEIHQLADHDSSSFTWQFHHLHPGRYIIRAVHAPWGCDNWLNAQFVSQCEVDVYKENWEKNFCYNRECTRVEEYLECLLTHWYRPQLVTRPPRVPMDISADDIRKFLEGIERVNKLEEIAIPRDESGALNLFCLNPQPTSEVVSCVQELPDFWEKILPSREILAFVPSEQDKKFIQEIAFQYTVLQTAARSVKQKFKQRTLSSPLKLWHKNLTKSFPPAGDVIFLCEKFRLFSKDVRRPAWKREYKLFKQPYVGREAI